MKETENREKIVTATNMWFEDILIGTISNLFGTFIIASFSAFC